jgi:hypothetical protein
MNEPVTEPTSAPILEPEAAPQPPPPRRSLMPWLAVIAYLLLVGAIGALWYRTSRPAAPVAADPSLAGIETRLAQLEQRPPSPAAAPDLTPRVEALERRAPPDLSSLQARLAGLEQRPPGDTTALATRIAALEQSLARGDRLTHVQAAAMALTAGRTLGDIPGAPAALTRFAHVKPPTEAALRLAFPAVANAALDASRPADDRRPILDRMLARAENLVTVRQGDHVLVGDPSAGILARARSALDAGDLSGTVTALADLRGGSATAMAGWLTDAAALRDARAALADMAAQP